MKSVNENQPLISVIVPVYKVEPYLDRCVESIVNQTYRNLEIILVNDGSPDNCPQMCDAWAERDVRIKVIRKENGGLSDARNAGMAAATGELVSFIDSDDYITPDFIEALYHAMMQTSADVVECAVDYVDEDGNILRQRCAAETSEMDRLEALRRLILEDGIYQTVWNKLYRREVCIPFEKGKLHEDEFFTWQVFERIEKLAVVQKPMYHYLQRSSSIIGTPYNIRRLDGLQARFDRMQAMQKYDGLAALTRQQFILDCMWHYQSVKRHLIGQERIEALRQVREWMKQCPVVPISKLIGKQTHRVWYVMFRMMPDTIVWVRNKVGIGL